MFLIVVLFVFASLVDFNVCVEGKISGALPLLLTSIWGNSLGGLVVMIYPNVWYTVYLPTTTLPATNIFAPENGWLEDDELSFLGRLGLFFRCKN